MSSLLPPTQSSIMADVLKRLERLELATRVPQITRLAGGITAATDALEVYPVAGGSFADPDVSSLGNPGPEVEVEVRDTGRLLVLITADVQVTVDPADIGSEIFTAAGPELTTPGVNAYPAELFYSAKITGSKTLTGGTPHGTYSSLSIATSRLYEGLAAGQTTARVVYAQLGAPSLDRVKWTNRTLTAVPL